MQKTRRNFTTTVVLRATVFATGALFAASGGVKATVVTWDPSTNKSGSDNNGAWDTSTAEWATGGGDVVWPNTSADTAQFGAGGSGAYTVTLGTPITAGSIVFNSGATYTIGGTTTNNVALGGGLTFNNNGTISAPIALSGSQTWTAAKSSVGTVSGAISGSYGINISGLGVIQLAGSNSFNGGVTVTGTSQVQITTGAGLGTGVFTLNSTNTGAGFYVRQNNALALANNVALSTAAGTYIIEKGVGSTNLGTQLTLSGNISGGGVDVMLELTGTSSIDIATTYLLSGTNTFTTGTNLLVNRGNLVVGNTSALTGASVTLQSLSNAGTGNLQFNVPGTFNNSITVASTGGDVLNTGTNAVALGGVISGSVPVTKIGTGIMTLTAANTYSAGTTINGGILQANTAGRVLNSDSSLKSSATGTGPVTIAATGVLAGNGGTGDVTVNSGGTITAGTGPSPTDTVATLHTGMETWNSGGVYAAKVGTDGNGADTSDELVMSGLTPASPTGFTIQITGLNGLAPVSGHSFIIAEVGNATSSSLATALSQITITYAGSAIGQTFNLSPSSQADPNGGYDIVANDVTPSPEPVSAILFGVAAAPLIMQRRRRSLCNHTSCGNGGREANLR